MSNKCRACAFDRSPLEEQLARVTEKLEHSQLQIRLLEAKYERLSEELREAKWNGISTVWPRKQLPSLPTECLHMILRLATSFDGPTFAHWWDRPQRNSWSQSSVTRRSITLVCHRWYEIGTEFLYEHVVLSRLSQAQALRQALEAKEAQPLRQDYVKFVRNVELVPRSSDPEKIQSFAAAVKQALALIPPQQLELFVVQLYQGTEPRYGSSDVVHKIGKLAGNVVQKHEKSLKILNLPFNPVYSDRGRAMLLPGIPLSTVLEQFKDGVILSKLHTLSLVGENAPRLGMDFMSWLRFPALKTLYLELTELRYTTRSVEVALQFITLMKGLTCLHLITDHVLVTNHIASIIRAAPALIQLSIYLKSFLIPVDVPSFPDLSDFTHRSLTEIKIRKDGTTAREVMQKVQIFFYMLESGVLPHLRSIIIRGPTYDGPSYKGCLDSDSHLSKSTRRWWRDNIALCARHNVALTDPFGYPIYLWDMVHGIQINGEGRLASQTLLQHLVARELCPGDNQADESTDIAPSIESASDDDMWVELEDDNNFQGSDAGSDEAVSDDSQDTPYRYVPQPDIDTVDHDSDVDSLYLEKLEDKDC